MNRIERQQRTEREKEPLHNHQLWHISQKECRLHIDVFLEMVGSFKNMNEALQYKRDNPTVNEEIYTHDGYVLKNNFKCKCGGTGIINE